jgi:hypothetical protein
MAALQTQPVETNEALLDAFAGILLHTNGTAIAAAEGTGYPAANDAKAALDIFASQAVKPSTPIHPKTATTLLMSLAGENPAGPKAGAAEPAA